MKYLVSLLLLAALAWGLPSEPLAVIEGRAVVQVLTVSNAYDNTNGEWGIEDICPEGTYVHAVSLKYEEPGHLDETAINGINLYCSDGSNDGGSVSSTVGRYGKEFGKQACTSPNMATGFKANVLEYQGPFTDDVAVEDFALSCGYGAEDVEGLPDEALKPSEKDFSLGLWSALASCDSPSKVCGLQTRWEDGSIGDEASIVDVKLYCCP